MLVVAFASVFSLLLGTVLDSLLVGGLGGLAFVLMGGLFVRLITRPLEKVAEAARQIVRGERAAPLQAPPSEVAVLANALNELLAAREQQTRELSASETQFLGTFENAAVGIAYIGLDCRWLRVNARLCEITAYPLEELLTKTFIDITHPDDREADLAQVRAMLAGEIPSYSMEKRYIRKDGGIVWVNLTVSLARDTAGLPAYMISVVEDISVRKQAEEELHRSEDRFRIAAESMSDLVYEVDLRDDTIQWFGGFISALGYQKDEFPLTMAGWEAVMHPDDRVWVMAEMQRCIEDGGAFSAEYRVLRKDGSICYWLDRGRTLYDAGGQAVRWVGAVSDVTERKRAEAEISAAKEAAEAASRAKDDFLATLSHELRTPLNPVLLLASEMEQSGELPPALREDFTLIRKNVALEARLIDDLLDLTRITRGKLQMERQRVNAHEVLKQAVAVVHADLVQKQIALAVEPAAAESWVYADPVRLQQIFWNVLNNAVKFTPAGGRITVRSCNTPERILCVEITDTGMGMTPEELARIFTAFGQGQHATQPNASHRFGGLGLGLAICRQLLAMHGGCIHARSAGLGLGSTFVIELPLLPAEEALPVPAPVGKLPTAAPIGAKHLHILLVEDHEPTRTTLNRLLSRRGHEVACADSLASARKLAADLATPQGAPGFDLLLSDLGLPDGSGCELMSELRNRYGSTLRGIALSGFGMEKDIQSSLDSGFSKHLTKPVDIQALESAMELK